MDERFQELVLFNFLKVPNPRIRIVLTIQAKNVHENLLKKSRQLPCLFHSYYKHKSWRFYRFVFSLLFSPFSFVGAGTY